MINTEKVHKPVTQNDVARASGVTRSMVSYVLNNTEGKSVAPETRRRILDAIAELGYKPNKYAQALQLGNAALADRQLGVILSSADVFLRPYYAEILAGIHTAAYENGYHVRFIRFFDELKNPILFNELIHPEEISGLILVAVDQCLKTSDDEKLIEEIRGRITPVVCVEWQHEGLSSVGFSRREAAFRAVSYLLEKGYGDVAYVGELDERVSGFKQALLEHGRSDLTSCIVEGAVDMRAGIFAMEKIGSRLPRAVCAGSDEVAIGILRYLNKNRIAVPAETAVVSIDNIEMAEYTNPPLTTINVQKKAMGARAVEMIVNKTAGQDENAMSVLLPLNLVERESA
ncbi:MAG TPA: LacI family transcriptional regulator [Treponema sp.]|nr:LacI family transcriptional regulator [Treponema sp.]